MKKTCVFVYLLFTLIFSNLFFHTAAAQTSNIKYFGYFGSNFIGENAKNTPTESADHTNIIWVYQGAADWEAQIREGVRLGQKTILDVLPLFYDDSNSSRTELRSDYQTRWQSFVNNLAPDLVSSIAAFYHVDELPPDVQDMTVSWSGITNPTPTDWIGMYPLNASDSNYIARLYVSSATCSRTGNGASGSCVFRAPASLGSYEFRIFANDTLTKLAASGSFNMSQTPNPGYISSSPNPIGSVTLNISTNNLSVIGPRVQAVRTVNAAIKSSFPQIPIAATFSGGYDLRQEQIDSGFDWIAFDCYGDFYVCQIPTRVATLKSMLGPNQKIILVPEGNSFTASDSTLVSRADLFYQLALSEPKVIAIFPITWSNYMEGSVRVFGVRDLPLTKAKYKEIGSLISGKSAPVVLAVTSASNVTSGQNITVAWSNRTNSEPLDWMAMYPAGVNDSSYVSRFYLSSGNCTKLAGGTSGSCIFPTSSMKGQYEFRMFSGDTLNKIAASGTVTITESATLPPVPPIVPPAQTGGGGGGGSISNIPPVVPPVTPLGTVPPISPNNSSLPTSYNFGTVTLRNGSTGEAVKELQRFLNRILNLGLVVDGKLGPKTIAVIKKWQSDNNLVADGLIGPKTKIKMNASLK
jgi:hypothetical protein